MARSDRWTFNRKVAEIYSDFTSNLDLNPETESLKVLVNEEDIKSRLRNLLLIRPMELPYSEVGSRVQNFLFDLATDHDTKDVRDEISFAISRFEPSITNVRVIVELDPDDANTVKVKIIFDVSNVAENVVLDTLIRRVR
jgi:phage baseplate assembly protein W